MNEHEFSIAGITRSIIMHVMYLQTGLSTSLGKGDGIHKQSDKKFT